MSRDGRLVGLRVVWVFFFFPAAPIAPALSLDPQQEVYRYGDYVKLLCSIPWFPASVQEVQYYADFGLAASIPVANVRNYSYDLRITGDERSGSYSCAYFVIQSRRPVRSEKSRWVNITVKSEFSNPPSLQHLITTGPSLANSFPGCLPMTSPIPSCPMTVRLSASVSLSVMK